jgi:hypothetical protein
VVASCDESVCVIPVPQLFPFSSHSPSFCSDLPTLLIQRVATWLQLRKTLSTKKAAFVATRTIQIGSRKVAVYALTESFDGFRDFWRAAPLVLASLLTTCLPKNQVGAAWIRCTSAVVHN